MSAGAGRGILLPLIVLLSLLYILIACLSGYLFNRQADGKSILGEYYSVEGKITSRARNFLRSSESLRSFCFMSIRRGSVIFSDFQ